MAFIVNGRHRRFEALRGWRALPLSAKVKVRYWGEPGLEGWTGDPERTIILYERNALIF